MDLVGKTFIRCEISTMLVGVLIRTSWHFIYYFRISVNLTRTPNDWEWLLALKYWTQNYYLVYLIVSLLNGRRFINHSNFNTMFMNQLQIQIDCHYLNAVSVVACHLAMCTANESKEAILPLKIPNYYDYHFIIKWVKYKKKKKKYTKSHYRFSSAMFGLIIKLPYK